jgi:uncharacterized coiled-coil protein SlyX
MRRPRQFGGRQDIAPTDEDDALFRRRPHRQFLKEHRKVEQLDATIAQQQQAIAAFTASLKAQAAQIQKVSNQLKAQRLAQRVVAND